MNLKLVRETLNSGAGKELKEYLLSKLRELKNIDNIKRFKTEKAQIIEVDSQQKAYDKLAEILGEIMTIEEFNETKPEKDQFFA